MQTGIVSRKVIGVQVDALPGSRKVRMRLVLEDSEILHIELALPTATRLADQLVDAEFQERRVAMSVGTRTPPALAQSQSCAA